MEKQQLGIVILAAGEASRMGQPKQLLKLNKQTLLDICLAKATRLNAGTIVTVLGAHLAQTQPVVEAFGNNHSENTCWVENPKWATGMGSSIRTGVRKILEVNPFVSAILILLADQPLISLKQLKEFISFFDHTPKAIAASSYHNTFGVPAIFGLSVFEALLELESKTGAKKIMKQHLSELVKFPLPEAAFDVDTPEEFEKIKAMANKI